MNAFFDKVDSLGHLITGWNETRYGDEKIQNVYGLPKNGLIVAQHICAKYKFNCIYDEAELTTLPVTSVIIVDDVIDSGKTMKPFLEKGYLTAVVYRKPTSPKVDFFIEETENWITIPFEKGEGVQENIVRVLQFIGEDAKREGLLDTPRRVEKMYGEIFGGYKKNVEDVMCKTFESTNDQMVIVKDIDFYSHCEHHLVPFFGKVHIGYIPKGSVLGLSKFARLVEIYARRLQIQENLTEQIAEAIEKHLAPLGVIVVIEAQHLCMAMRGVQKLNSTTVTCGLRGVFQDDGKAKAEFLSLIK